MNGTITHNQTGAALRDGVLSLGLTFTEFSKQSKLSLTSLRKIFDDSHVRESTRNKAWVTFRRLKRREEFSTV
jgi:predicted transcriptional regulator